MQLTKTNVFFTLLAVGLGLCCLLVDSGETEASKLLPVRSDGAETPHQQFREDSEKPLKRSKLPEAASPQTTKTVDGRLSGKVFLPSGRPAPEGTSLAITTKNSVLQVFFVTEDGHFQVDLPQTQDPKLILGCWEPGPGNSQGRSVQIWKSDAQPVLNGQMLAYELTEVPPQYLSLHFNRTVLASLAPEDGGPAMVNVFRSHYERVGVDLLPRTKAVPLDEDFVFQVVYLGHWKLPGQLLLKLGADGKGSLSALPRFKATKTLVRPPTGLSKRMFAIRNKYKTTKHLQISRRAFFGDSWKQVYSPSGSLEYKHPLFQGLNLRWIVEINNTGIPPARGFVLLNYDTQLGDVVAWSPNGELWCSGNKWKPQKGADGYSYVRIVVEVTWLRDNSSEAILTVKTGNGTFKLSDFRLRDNFLVADFASASKSDEPEFESVSGTLTLPRDCEKLSGWVFKLIPERVWSLAQIRKQETKLPEFSFNNLTPGTYKLYVRLAAASEASSVGYFRVKVPQDDHEECFEVRWRNGAESEADGQHVWLSRTVQKENR